MGIVTPSILRGLSHEYQQPQGIRTAAAWVYPPISPQQMVNDADVIVLVTSKSTYRGRVVMSSAGQPIQFELVDLIVEEVLKGAPPGVITIERLASTQREQPVTVSDDGGPYAAGGRFLLFLKKPPDAPYFFLLNDQGRYVVRQGRVDGVTSGTVSAAVGGRSLPQAVMLIRQLGATR